MRWPAKRERGLYDWNRWFAWRPVRIGAVWIWGEHVERRVIPPIGLASVVYDYRLER